jgi:polar amino acid transport system substrate-binding protein
MENIMKLTKLIIALIISVIAFTGCTEKKETIVMGTNAAFPPFEYIGGASGDEVVGFDAEIAKEIAKDLGVELRIEDMEFDTLLTALNADKIDFVIAGMTINPKRAESVNFSAPYYEATQAVIVKKGQSLINVMDDIKDKKISVQLGTTGNDMASKYTAEAKISAFNTGFEAVMELKNGKVDCLIIDQQPALNFLTKNPELEILSFDFEPEYYGIAIKKENKELLESVDKTLKRLKASGKYDELLSQFMK